MGSDWLDDLKTQAAGSESLDRQKTSIWAELQTRVDISEYKPKPHADVVAQEIKDKAEHYFVLKNTQYKTYLRLSPDEYSLWLLMDGQKTVKELIVEHFISSGAFSRTLVIQLVDQLLSHKMLSEKPLYVWGNVKSQLRNRTWGHRLSIPAQILLTQQLKIAGIDKLVSGVYRTAGWLFFTRPVQVIMLALAVVGFILFNAILSNPNYVLFAQVQPSEFALLWVAAILPIVIHEFGHALTVKHYGRQINAGGLMLYFGLPAAYVDTTDIWLENRRARLNVTWNGPYTGLLVGGLCAIFMWLYPNSSINSFLFKMASVAYLTILININPLLKYDGYYLLSDALNISFLRERSLNFLQKGLLGKLTRREKLTRDEKIFAVFGAFSMLWTAYVIYLASVFWQTRLSSGLQVILGSNYNVLTKVLEFISAAAFISLMALLFIQLLRFIFDLVNRFVRAGLLQKHAWLALIGLALAAITSFGAAYSVEIYRGWVVVAVVSGLGMATITAFLIFNHGYYISNRWWSQVTLALALGSLVMVPVSEALMPTGSIHSQYLVFASIGFASIAGVLFIWPAIGQVKPLQLVIGMVTGGFLALAGYYFDLLHWTLFLAPLLGFVATLNWFNLRGGARFPGLALVYLGILLAAMAFVMERYIPRYWALGILVSCAGFWHLILARLPHLSKYDPAVSLNKKDSISYSVSILVKRAIAQVFFESGWGGINAFGMSFSTYTHGLGIDLKISGNQFTDGELSQRDTVDLTEVYGVAFDKIHELMKTRFGDRFTHQIISLGIDLIPWQYREVINELVLVRRDWGKQVKEEKINQRAERIKLLDRVPLFFDATYEDLEPIAEMLSAKQYAAHEVVIRQGDPGDAFYIIQSGKLQVWQSEGDGDPVQVQSLGPGQFFGETALVTNAPRNATIITETPSMLLLLGREDFDTLVKHHLEFAQQIKVNLRHHWVLRNMPVFDELSAFDLIVIANKLKAENYAAGETVIRQGDPGDKFYIVETGELAACHDVGGKLVELDRLTAGDYFGETALIHNRPRTASVLTVTDAVLFSLDRQDFINLLDDFQHMRQLVEKTSTRRLKN